MIKIEGFILLPSYQTNTWLLWDTKSLEALLIDPAAPDTELKDTILERGLKLKAIVNTHGHGDHIGGNFYYKKAFDVPILIHSLDAAMLTDNKKNLSEYMGESLQTHAADEHLEDGSQIALGEYQVQVIHTPGHTQGSISLLADKYLIAGDTLFAQGIGRTDLPGGSYPQIISSIQDKLFRLPDDTIVFPGHGPRTSIGLEKQNNPFLR